MSTRKNSRVQPGDSNDLFTSTINAISDAVLLLDRNNNIVFVNSSAPTVLGLSQDILGTPLDQVLTIEDPSTTPPLAKINPQKRGSADLLASVGDTVFSATAIDIRQIDFRALRKKAVIALLIRPPDPSLASAPNIHQQIIGQLTMRIAHDFNNSLTSMLGNAELVQEALEVTNAQENNSPDTPAGHAVPINNDVIRKCLEMAAFIRKLQDYAKQQPAPKQHIDLNAAIQETLPISQKILGSKLAIEFTPGRNLPSVLAHSVQLHQLLFTVFDNCKERANTAQATVALETSLETFDEASTTHPGARAGEHLKLSVTDKGTPLPADAFPNASNLFRSEKTANSGLHLATVYAIVKQLGGYVYVHSNEFDGTRFDIYFPLGTTPRSTPASEQTQAPRPDRQSTALPQANGKHRLILIAEDQADIQLTMIRCLSKAGFLTDVNANGLDAWTRFQELNSAGNLPSLVIADLGLPGLDGRTLCNKIKAADDRVPVLLTSGHVIPLDDSRTKTVEGLPFIQKPFDSETLVRTITTLLQTFPK